MNNCGITKNEEHTFYIGDTQFIMKKNNKPIKILLHYINTCIKDTYGLIINKNIQNINNVLPLLFVHMFHACASYNKVILPLVTFVTTDKPVFLSEPVYLKFKTNKLVIYISESMLKLYLQHKVRCNFTFNDEDFRLDIINFNKDNKVMENQMLEVLLKLLTVAEHALLHYIQIIKLQYTDWVMHKNFINFTDSCTEIITAHTILNIHCTTIPFELMKHLEDQKLRILNLLPCQSQPAFIDL